MMIINTKTMKKERFIDLTSILGDKSHITDTSARIAGLI